MIRRLRTPRTDRTRTRRGRGDDGAVLVEFALFAPVLVLIGMGLVEFGLVFDQEINLNTATRAAARAGTNTTAGGGAGTQSDWLILNGLAGALADLESDQVERVIIYEATGNGEPPAACKSAVISTVNHWTTVPGSNCNLYDGVFVYDIMPLSAPTGLLWDTVYHAAGADAGWFPGGYVDGIEQAGNERDTELEPNPPGPEYLGVYIEIEHEFLTGIFGSSMNVSDYTVMRLEPAQAGQNS